MATRAERFKATVARQGRTSKRASKAASKVAARTSKSPGGSSAARLRAGTPATPASPSTARAGGRSAATAQPRAVDRSSADTVVGWKIPKQSPKRNSSRAIYELEDTATPGHPSRKSTRKSAQGQKAATTLTARQQLRISRPNSVHDRGR